MGSSALPLILLMSLVHSGLSQVKPVVTVKPDQRVFSGERVTLTCDMQGGEDIQWYSWSRDGNTDYQYTTTAYYSFTADVSLSGEYRCRGVRSGSWTDFSDAVTLTVSDKPTLTVTPQSSVFTGDTVTLRCDVGSSTGWTFLWRKDSNRESSDGGTKTISSVRVSDGGTYECRAERGNYYTQYSKAIQITVRERPKPVVVVQPDVGVFRGERVTLTCVIQETGVWRYSWYKDQDNSRRTDQIYNSTGQDQIYNSTGQDQIYIISSVDPSHAGLYRCRGTQTETPQNSEISDGVTLTVSDLPTSTVTVTPDRPVFTGETVNLKCVINSGHSDWRYEWNKDSVKLQTSERYTVNRDTVTIRGATESDQGQYWCRGQRDGRRPSFSQESNRTSISVNASSSHLAVGVFVGLSVCLLFFISLVLLWRHKHKKDQHRNIQTSVPNPSGESQALNSPLQSDSDHIYNDVTPVNSGNKDVTYSEVTFKKNKSVDKDKTMAESNNVMYSEVGKKGKKCKSKDIKTAGPSDLTYAQINIQDKKKSKSKGADAGVGDATYKF